MSCRKRSQRPETFASQHIFACSVENVHKGLKRWQTHLWPAEHKPTIHPTKAKGDYESSESPLLRDYRNTYVIAIGLTVAKLQRLEHNFKFKVILENSALQDIFNISIFRTDFTFRPSTVGAILAIQQHKVSTLTSGILLLALQVWSR